MTKFSLSTHSEPKGGVGIPTRTIRGSGPCHPGACGAVGEVHTNNSTHKGPFKDSCNWCSEVCDENVYVALEVSMRKESLERLPEEAAFKLGLHG